MPVCVVSDLEIDYCKRLIYAGTFGRGIWVAPLPALPATAEEVITTNTTLPAGSVTNWGANIRVTPGNTLTVKGLLNMSEDKRIIVQRGPNLLSMAHHYQHLRQSLGRHRGVGQYRCSFPTPIVF